MRKGRRVSEPQPTGAVLARLADLGPTFAQHLRELPLPVFEATPRAPGTPLREARVAIVSTAEITGEATKIAFNSRYLQDVLNALSVEKVALEMTSPSSQGVFRPVGETDYVHVVMPMSARL